MTHDAIVIILIQALIYYGSLESLIKLIIVQIRNNDAP